MKRSLFATLSLTALLTASAYAQHAVEANIPFAFNVGYTHMPAGTYNIKVDALSGSITIRNCDNSAIILSHGQREYPGKMNQTLVFRQASDQYFLAEVWGEQGTQGMILRAPKPQPRLEEASQRAPSTNEVLVALK